METEKIKIIGKKDLTKEEIEAVTKLGAEYYPKIERIIKNLNYITVHVKKSDRTGERKRYDVIVKVVAPLPKIESTATEWDIKKATHMAFDEILRILEHRLHK